MFSRLVRTRYRNVGPNRSGLLPGALIAITSVTSCGESNVGDIEFGQIESAIAGGSVDEEGHWNSVVLLRTPMPGSTQACTGTLVAPNLVLTALHCVAPLRDADFTCNSDGTVTQNKPGAGELSTPVAANLVEIRVGLDAVHQEPAARGKVLITTKSPNICHNDLALVILDTELDLPIARLRLDTPMTLGEPLTIVGYGMTSVSGDEVTRRYVENIRVQDIGLDTGGTATSGAPPRTIVVGASACKGDSGGPAFAHLNDEPAVAGVDSIVVGTCGSSISRSIFTRLAPFKKLILSSFEEAGYPAWLEGQVAPGVEPQAPDAGADDTTEDDTDDAVTPRPQRLKTGCSVGALPLSTTVPRAFVAALVLGALGWLRRKVGPRSS